MFHRWYEPKLRALLSKPYVHLMFGARQTGKSTLLRALLPPDCLEIDLADPATRSRYARNPERFTRECQGLSKKKGGNFVFIDEAQLLPAMFDSVQYLYDREKLRWRFVLCGSSARKLRKTGANLLPGRSLLHRLFPLTLAERPPLPTRLDLIHSPLEFSWPLRKRPKKLFPVSDLEARLAYGELPGIAAAPEEDRVGLLKSYAVIHLEEEIRREALIKDWGAFLRYLRLAASESGQITNYTAISNESGVSQPTVKSYYQLLEDMFVGFSLPAWSKSARKSTLSTPRFYFFDVGVRNAASGISASRDVVLANPGPLFEQWVGIELWKRLQYLGAGSLYYFRTKDGSEVDFILEREGSITPIEVKWTENPTPSDARHVATFLNEHPRTAKRGFVVCRCERPLQLHDKVLAIPWSCL